MSRKTKIHPHTKIIRELEDCLEKLQKFGPKVQGEENDNYYMAAWNALDDAITNIRQIDM